MQQSQLSEDLAFQADRFARQLAAIADAMACLSVLVSKNKCRVYLEDGEPVFHLVRESASFLLVVVVDEELKMGLYSRERPSTLWFGVMDWDSADVRGEVVRLRAARAEVGGIALPGFSLVVPIGGGVSQAFCKSKTLRIGFIHENEVKVVSNTRMT